MSYSTGSVEMLGILKNVWPQATHSSSVKLRFLIHNTPKVVAHSLNPSVWEVEAGRRGVWGQPELNTEFEAGHGYVRPCLSPPQQNTFVMLLKIREGDTVCRPGTTGTHSLHLALWSRVATLNEFLSSY